MSSLLKKVQYRNFDGPSRYAEVVYIILGDQCVFSGIGPKPCTPTVHAATAVISAICEAEKFQPLDLTFFDLQTLQGCGFIRGGMGNPGEFAFDQIFVDAKGNARSWTPSACPPSIVNIFSEHIGPNPMQFALGKIMQR